MGAFLMSILLLLLTAFDLLSGKCNDNTGPSGGYECVKLSKYDNIPQWATCLTNDYIRAKSHIRGQEHECVDNPATFCWYQCMCETYDECDGPDVYGDCACDPGPHHEEPYPTVSPRPTLPPWCFSPDGKTCSWYRDCLLERYPCEETDAEHAVTYAQVFCELYSSHQQTFTTVGQQWIAAVRMCLQVELVPIFRPWVTVSCDGIKNQAFASHAKCYESQITSVSLCSLHLSDQLKIFWTIKGAFTNAFVEPVKDLWDMLFECLKHRTPSDGSEEYYTALIQIFVRKQTFIDDNTDTYAGKIIDAIAKQHKWEQAGIAWFGYAGHAGTINKTTDKGDNTSTVRPVDINMVPKVRIDVLLAVKHVFDLNYQNRSSVNMTDTVMSLTQSMEWGVMWLETDIPVEVLSMTVCGDINCNSAFLQVTSPLYCEHTAVSAGSIAKMQLWFILLILGVYLGKYIFNYNIVDM